MLHNIKNGKTKAVILFVVLLFSAANILAQPKVKIKLTQPPPDNLTINSVWDIDIDNITKEPVKVSLASTVSEAKDGLIIEGKSKVITVKPGRTKYTYKDFPNAEVKYNNGKYKEIILRTGNAPEGSYTICVTAFEENGEIAGQENCIEQTVRQQGSISLISPEDGAEFQPPIDPGMLTFSWVATGLKGPYTLRIVELKGDQSPDVAIKENRPILDKVGIKGFSYQYSLADPKLEAGKKYVWMVTSDDVGGDPGRFSVNGVQASTGTKFNLELLVNGKTAYETNTSTNGEFKFSGVAVGEYNLRITAKEGETPERFLLTIGSVSIIICCCPGPPCEDPLVIFIGKAISREGKAIFFENNQITARLCPCKDCCPPPKSK